MRITLFNLRRSGVTEEELSAYIDGSLDAASRARIDDRLARSEELRASLEALRATVALLRSADPLQAPRSFAVTPAMAYGAAMPVRVQGFGRISPLMPAMAAAAAALALGLLLVGNLTGSLRQAGQDAEGASELSMSAQGAISTQAVMTTQAPVVVATVVVEKERSFKAAQATPEAESAPPMMAVVQAQATSTPAPAPVSPAGPQSAAAPVVTPVETPIGAERAVTDTEAGQDATQPADGQGSEAGADGASGAATTETAQPADQLTAPGTPQESPEPGLELPLWQIEAALAALAAVLGAAAVAAAVRQRRRSP